MDFSLHSYQLLLSAFLKAGYEIMPFEQWLSHSSTAKALILRHDVDKRPENSLRTAEIEHQMGIRASYYFRIVGQSNHPDTIRRIAALGHEIGYHYEDMSLCKGDRVKALSHFCNALDYFRRFYPVRTICMHGSPASRFDSRDLWRDAAGKRNNGGDYDYRTYGIIGEPYFDVDFSRVFYLTDTGGMWDGFRVSVRDKVPMQDEWIRNGWVFHTTNDIIKALSTPLLKPVTTVMMTTHPQRWDDRWLPRLREQIWQGMKNIVKRLLIAIR